MSQEARSDMHLFTSTMFTLTIGLKSGTKCEVRIIKSLSGHTIQHTTTVVSHEIKHMATPSKCSKPLKLLLPNHDRNVVEAQNSLRQGENAKDDNNGRSAANSLNLTDFGKGGVQRLHDGGSEKFN